MKFSRRTSDILWQIAERYLASLPEEERNQILSNAKKTCSPSTKEQTTLSINS
jgi:hypothetical protein